MFTFTTPLNSDAIEYGDTAAIFLAFFRNRTKFLQSNDNYQKEGRTWLPYTMQRWAEELPWLSAQRIRRIIRKLEDAGILLRKFLSPRAADRTTYLAFADEADQISKIPSNQNRPKTPKIAYPKHVPPEASKLAESVAQSPTDDRDVIDNGHLSPATNGFIETENCTIRVKIEDLNSNTDIPHPAPASPPPAAGKLKLESIKQGCSRIARNLVDRFSPQKYEARLNGCGEVIHLPLYRDMNARRLIVEDLVERAHGDYGFLKSWSEDWKPHNGRLAIPLHVNHWREVMDHYRATQPAPHNGSETP